jgi:hypothetical protein
MDARWQGLNITLTIPQRKLPIKAMDDAPVIHACMVMKKESSIRHSGRYGFTPN